MFSTVIVPLMAGIILGTYAGFETNRYAKAIKFSNKDNIRYSKLKLVLCLLMFILACMIFNSPNYANIFN